MHSSINELGLLNPLLICSYRLALKSKIVLEFSNISVVRDFLNIFSEVLPGCHLTAMLEFVIKLVSCNHPFHQESMFDTPELVG